MQLNFINTQNVSGFKNSKAHIWVQTQNLLFFSVLGWMLTILHHVSMSFGTFLFVFKHFEMPLCMNGAAEKNLP